MPAAGFREPITERILRRVLITDDGCWEWQGNRFASGYGRIEIRTGTGRSTRVGRGVHRVSYEAFVGPVPEHLVLDHLCRNRVCCNPAHLEPVTNRENTLRGIGPTAVNAVKTTCDNGHELSGANVRVSAGKRKCVPCHLEIKRAYRERRRAERAA